MTAPNDFTARDAALLASFARPITPEEWALARERCAPVATRRCHYGTVGCRDTSDTSHECTAERRCVNCLRRTCRCHEEIDTWRPAR